MEAHSLSIPAKDGFKLAATKYCPAVQQTVKKVVTINSATAVPQRYYKSFASYLADCGYTVITYDYRGIGASRPPSLRGFSALARDWTLLDMAGIVDWVVSEEKPQNLYHIGHSYGGQTAGLLPNGDKIDAMVTVSSQSGHWKLQGGWQKLSVAFHVHFTLPLLALIFGYVPWSKFSSAEDLPKGVAIEWAKWCRMPGYFLDDTSLPLNRYQKFKAPVFAYSFADDNWGTKRSVDAMMKVYPNLQRRHIRPNETGMDEIGHVGFFKPKAKKLWAEIPLWLEHPSPT